MNTLIDIRSLLDKPYTGVARYTLNFLNDLLEKDKENNYFLFYNSAKHQNEDLPNFNYANVRIIDFHRPNKLLNFCFWLLKWPKIDKLAEKKTGKKIDEIFLPNFNFVSFSQKTKTTLVVHDLSFKIYSRFFTLKQRLWHKLIQPKKICQQVTKIIVHAENTKNDLINLYKIDPSKIEVKKPTMAQKFCEPIESEEKTRVKEKYQLPDNFILYLGNLEPRKNLDTLFRAFSQVLYSKSYIPSPSLIIVGQGREQKKLQKLVHDLKISEQIKFLGYIPEEDKKALYYLTKLFVYPSFYEGYGYPVVEALACGLPVITSHTSSLTEIESGKITFINPYNVNDLAEAINSFLLTKSI